MLGPPFFVAPGILSEKIFLTSADVTGKPQREPPGDGSPMEEGATLRWRSLPSLRAALRSGEIQDAKTEIAVARLLESEASHNRLHPPT
jgi:ADP-ribose pyrophosphatase